VGRSVPEARIEEIYQKILASKQNIVLVGMPGCGKSTVGKIVASELGFEFIDTDEEIIKATGKTPAQIITESGEKSFRDVETSVISEISSKQGKVIATGGGAVLRKENVDSFKYNGRIYFLDRNIEDIKPTDDRPLSKDFESLKKLYNERYEIYLSVCDKRIQCVDEIKANVNAIIKDVKL
jgi:shikimate dehydrogenase